MTKQARFGRGVFPRRWREARRKRQVFIAVGYAVILPLVAMVFLPLAGAVSTTAALSAGLLYILSHSLRAIRLAVLSVEMLGVSARTAATLHFATAPFSLVLPLKSGELIRFYALWKASGNAVNAIIVLLIDRMYDSIFLAPMLLLLMIEGGAPTQLVVFTLLAATVPLTVVVVGPKLLREVQRYVVVSHNNLLALDALRSIDATRRLVSSAARVSRRQASELAVTSLMIWLCELLACVILVASAVGTSDGTLEFLGTRLAMSWWSGDVDPLVTTAFAIMTITLLLPWPVTAALYFARWKDEPRRVPAMERSKASGVA